MRATGRPADNSYLPFMRRRVPDRNWGEQDDFNHYTWSDDQHHDLNALRASIPATLVIAMFWKKRAEKPISKSAADRSEDRNASRRRKEEWKDDPDLLQSAYAYCLLSFIY